ncbi:amino acid adenylation domain-containing protein, partial [Paenibacillus sp. JCM 10914]|uniref:non-ribosomal peptide synthetase n=1 Tax=Paenibacillus sp. JCM 10914 TaxID=1236974 RepID=UPI00055E0489
IERMAGHWRRLLEAVAQDPEQAVGRIGLLGDDELEQMQAWNETTRPYADDKPVHELFEEQATKTPDVKAVAFEDVTLTYAELNRRSNQLAHYLRQQGVGPESLVAICMERSANLIVAMLGVLKAGGAYVPLDPSYPQERLTYMLADSGASVVVTTEKYLGLIPNSTVQTVCLDRDGFAIGRCRKGNLKLVGTAESLAYVMYTSGSTGSPKGVCILHCGIVRLVNHPSYVELGEKDVVLQTASISFDAATFEIWGSLLNGGRLIVMSTQTPSVSELGEMIIRQGVTTLWMTNGLFNLMVDEQVESLRGVSQLLVGGDAISKSHVRKVLQWPGVRLINCYGPTENTTFTSYYEVERNREYHGVIPIGKPISNTQVYVLDGEMQPVPVGVRGELYTGGDGLARGYWNRPELTAEKFIVHPQWNKRLYRTGDLVRWQQDGNLEYLGRADEQVKVRGYRIELGEIEVALLRHPLVGESVVIVRDDMASDKTIVAYVVTSGNVELRELREYLKATLPDYMVPSYFMTLDSLPLMPNGKLDRKALPAPEVVGETEYAAPRTEVEQKLAEIWRQVLRAEQVGIHDNFFELGGDSILSIQIVSRANQAGLKLTPR